MRVLKGKEGDIIEFKGIVSKSFQDKDLNILEKIYVSDFKIYQMGTNRGERNEDLLHNVIANTK